MRSPARSAALSPGAPEDPIASCGYIEGAPPGTAAASGTAAAPGTAAATPATSEPASADGKGPAESAGEDDFAKRFRSITFPDLSAFDYAQPTAAELDAGRDALDASFERRVPADIRSLAGQKVAIEGFMQPIDFDKEGVLSFALVHNAVGCCFGTFPNMNEWVLVEMAGDERAEYFTVEPATVYGTLEVGEIIEDGYVESLYRMKAERVFGTF